MRPDVPSLRHPTLIRAFERSLTQASERGDFRVVHYSLQSNHAHLLVESAHRDALARGMKAVGARLARAVNRVFHRVGPVLADRYHLRVLKTPREVRNALRYVLLNARHHAARLMRGALLDPASSARWFGGWTLLASGSDVPNRGPVARAQTWLLAVGWRRHGLIDPADVPGTG
jgi:REP element-mobilizing transposase RayT